MKTVILGDNGSGKSTILDLLMRFYEPHKGKILAGKTDVSAFMLSWYRNLISVVSQNVYLFDDSIRNNIRLYKKLDDEEIVKICELSGLKDFVDEVGLEYMVGNNGSKLSGGQKQKIALARALVHDKPIILFDEATANVDNDSIRQINGLLHTKLKDKTVLIISHQKEILKDADQVFILKDGQILMC